MLTLSRDDFERLMGGDSLAPRLLKILSQALRALGIRFVNVERGDHGVATSPHEKGRTARVQRTPPRVDGFDISIGQAPGSSGVDLSTWEAGPRSRTRMSQRFSSCVGVNKII